MPDAVSQDAANRARIAAGLAKVGARVILDAGAGHDSSFLVQATDAQLDALATRLTGVYRNSVEQVRAWFEYADDLDVLEGAGLIVDTATMRPNELPVPHGWALAVGPKQPVYWLVHFTAGMGFPNEDWLALLMDETGPFAKPAPIVVPSYTATQLVARMSAAQARQVRRLPGVDWVGRYEAVLKLGLSLGPSTPCQAGRAGAEELLRSAEARPQEQIELSVGLFDSSQELVKAIAAEGGSVSAGGENTLIVKGPRRLIRWLARRVEVQFIEVKPERELK
jgi:hypothetical protein